MSTVLITGGTGLIGKALTNMLLEQGYEIIVLTRDPSKYINATRIQDFLCRVEC